MTVCACVLGECTARRQKGGGGGGTGIEKLKEELAIKKNENQEAAAAAASELAAVEGNLKRYSEEKVNVARKRVEEASSEAAIKANNLLNVQIENADVKYALKEFLVKEG